MHSTSDLVTDFGFCMIIWKNLYFVYKCFWGSVNDDWEKEKFRTMQSTLTEYAWDVTLFK